MPDDNFMSDTPTLPAACIAGRFDISADGRWWHEGRPIARPELVRLFAGILRRDGAGYALVTPVERVPVQVARLPFRITDASVADDAGGAPCWWLESNVGDRFPLDDRHLLVNAGNAEKPLPCVHVRQGLWAELERALYYRLCAQLETHPASGRAALRSTGSWHFLD